MFYKGFVETRTIEITDRIPDYFKVKRYPKKLVYSKNSTVDDLDLTELVLELYYNSGEPEEYDLNKVKENCDVILNARQNRIEIGKQGNSTVQVAEIPIAFADVGNSISLSVKNSIELIRYRPGDTFDFSKLKVKAQVGSTVIKEFEGDQVYYDPIGVPESYEKDSIQVTYNINGSTTQLTVLVVNAYTEGAELTIKNDYYNVNYEGEIIYFNNSKYFTFYEILDKKGEKPEIQPDDNGEYPIKYSTSPSTYDKAYELSTPLQLKATNGVQKVYFYYKYQDYKNRTDAIYSWTCDLRVEKPKLKGIEATFTLNDPEVLLPLEATPDPDFEQNYGTWDIKAIWTTGEVPITTEDCTFEFVNNNNSNDDPKKKTIKVTLKGKYDSEKSVNVNMPYGAKVLKSARLKTQTFVSLEKKSMENGCYNYKFANSGNGMIFIYSDGSESSTSGKDHFYSNTDITSDGIKEVRIKEHDNSAESLEFITLMVQKVEEQQ